MANWYSTDWWHRVPVLLKADRAGGATHADFPALLAASLPAHFWSKVRVDGLDCMLTQADGVTPLFREVATFDAGTEKPEIHFRLPSYSHLEDTLVYLYYRNPDYSEPSDVEVWDSSFAAVYHMNDNPADSTQILDSTANGNTGTKGAGAKAPTEVAGGVGRAQQSNGTQYATVGDVCDIGAGDLTLSALVKPDAVTSDSPRYAIGKANASGQDGRYALGIATDGFVRVTFDSGHPTVHLNGVTPVTALAWHSLAFVVDRDVGERVYLNGVSDGVRLGATPGNFNTTIPLQLCAYGNNAVGMIGATDELRISSVARSAEWIASEYNWLLNNALCYEVGDYENRPLYIMQGYRRVKDAATFDAQAYRRLLLPVGYIAQAYRRLTLPAGYIAQAYRRLADRALYTLATKRRLRPLYRVAERIRYGLDHREKPYGLDHREKPYGLDHREKPYGLD